MPDSRRLIRIFMVAIVTTVACTDAFVPGPNTDVGLFVWGEVSPARLSITDSSAKVRIRVYVRNPSSREIRVPSGAPPYTFTRDPAKSRGLWGSFRVACDDAPLNCGPNTDWWGDTVYVFPAGETTYNGTEFSLRSWASGGWPIEPRAYHIRVWFNGREGKSATLNIIP